MGNRSKFSFPLPGRHRHSRETKSRGPAESPTVSSSSGLSKAQRILGTEGDLNIDSPTWDDLSTRSSDGQSWRVPTRRSSGMSISISESTQSTTYESEVGHNSDKWEQESGVFPRVRGNKASSTLLGQHYNDGATDSSGGRLRHEDSSSTLKSYYDRQKSPLAISQQTSESSARDLALRKGCPPVSSFQRSPLLQVDNADPFEHQFADGNALSQDKSRKKPAKLDLSMLFAKSRRNGKDDIASPSSVLTTESGNHSRRKLTKAPSKESLRSHRQSIRSNHTGPFNQANTNTEEMKGHRRSNSDQKRRETKGTLYQLYDHYEQLPTRSPRMSQIPETRVADPEIPPRMYRQHPDPMPTPPKSSTSRSTQDSQSTPARESFSWKNVRASMASPQQWEGQASSAASISSRNSKTSRHTSASQFSHNDLRQHSVLSLSSDSDSEQELIETARQELSLPQKNSSGGHNTQKAPDHQRIQQSSNPIETMAFPQPPRPESRTKIHNSRKPAQTPSPFLAIPEVETPNPRASQPRQSKDTTPRSAASKDKKPPKRTASVTSATSQQPTPPLSPNSMAGDLQSQPQRSSRFMAVTKQEEALLEALRQKRANMRDKIINEHERMKTPPEMSKSDRSRNRFSEASSTGTVRASSTSNKKEEILLYLDTPIANMKPIYSAEPSPDLSDFLTFGASDEDTTPRKSRVQSTRGRPRPDSSVSPILDRGASSFSSMIPPTVRLSAVGSNAGFRESRTKKRSASSGVRFADDNIQQECPIEDNDTSNGSSAVWGLSGHI